ncbi:MAG: penicillin-binding protein 2 [Patescibacteria group bacterium]|nr:penicillin-binding protein 2 [Patescibacteria group bacterium]
MWRKDERQQKKKKESADNNRLGLVVAIIFLLAASLIGRLFYLQIIKHDTYRALAADQHESSGELAAERGKILITDSLNRADGTYALATNKDFYLIFGIPKDIEDPVFIAEQIYEFFDAATVLEEVEAAIGTTTPLLEEESLTDKIKRLNNDDSLDAETRRREIDEAIRYEHHRQEAADLLGENATTKEQLITTKKAAIIEKYQTKLSRPGGQYTVIRNKVSNQTLLDFYAFMNNRLASSTASSTVMVKPDDLMISVGQVVNRETKEAVKIKGFSFETKKFRYYPEETLGSQLLGFVSYADSQGAGRYGLEQYFNKELSGTVGYYKGEFGNNNSVIVNDREYVEPVPGVDIVLTVDRSLQFFACEELEKTVKKFNAKGGTVLAMDVKTGAILAMCSAPNFDPNNYGAVKDLSIFKNPAITDQYEPGSVFKAITMAIALNEEKVTPNTIYHDSGEIYIQGWSKAIRNSDFSTKGAHGDVDMNYVLENSLNTGAIYAMRQVGAGTFADYVENFGFGKRTGVELSGEAFGNINNLKQKKIKDIDAAVASFGQGISVTPLQMLSSYQVFANDGYLMKPYIVKEIRRPDGQVFVTSPVRERQVISAKTATTILGMLGNVVVTGHSKKADIPGYYIGGKTGTAQIAVDGKYIQDRYNHTFVGIAPIDNPRFVLLTRIDSPEGVQYAEGSALPLWTEVAKFMLQYYEVPKSK